MPGFQIGKGAANRPAANKEIRRKHRWELTIDGMAGSKSVMYLQKASRPAFKFEEVPMHHDQEVVWFAGKQTWDPITITFYDVQDAPDTSADVYKWLLSVVDISKAEVKAPTAYKQKAGIKDLGNNEKWTLYNAWPKEVNWQDLDYTNTALQQIDVVLRYDRAVRE